MKRLMDWSKIRWNICTIPEFHLFIQWFSDSNVWYWDPTVEQFCALYINIFPLVGCGNCSISSTRRVEIIQLRKLDMYNFRIPAVLLCLLQRPNICFTDKSSLWIQFMDQLVERNSGWADHLVKLDWHGQGWGLLSLKLVLKNCSKTVEG